MVLLVPLIVTTVTVRLVGLWRRRRTGVSEWSWPTAMSCGLAAVFATTSVTHFLQPYRSGLVAIVPDAIPASAEMLVTLSGLMEAVIAIGLLIPRTRTAAAAAAIVLLVAVFPANVVAAQGVDHPYAPDTPLLPRLALQLVFAGTATAVLVGERGCRRPLTHTPRRREAGPSPS